MSELGESRSLRTKGSEGGEQSDWDKNEDSSKEK